jgi:hypothetical protein
MNISHRIGALAQKTDTASYTIESKIHQDDFTEAAYLVNDYLKGDSSLKILMGGDFNIFPEVADGPAGAPSYPYIRYSILPAIGQIWRIRTDVVRYYVGEKSFKTGGEILGRLQELLIIDDADLPFPMKNGKFKIHSIEFLGGSNPSGPDQEEGIIERGLNIAIIYTVLS